MKTLQNDFTTPEQSKRLLELGVPADSANCYYTQSEIEGSMYWADLNIKREYQPCSELHAMHIWGKTLPCWSVGRLIEIYELCSGKKYERKAERLVRKGNVSVMKELTIIEDVIGDIINARLYIHPHMDFSKLEEKK